MLIVCYQYLSVFNWTNIQWAICIDNGTSNIHINNLYTLWSMCTKLRLMTGTGTCTCIWMYTCIQLTEMYLTMALLKPLNIGRSWVKLPSLVCAFDLIQGKIDPVIFYTISTWRFYVSNDIELSSYTFKW